MGTGAKSSIREVIESVKTGQGAKTPEKFWVNYARVSEEEAERIFKATGIRIDTNYTHVFVGNSAIHAQRQHGVGNEAWTIVKGMDTKRE